MRSPQRRARRDVEPDAVRLGRGHELGRAALEHLDAILPAGKGRPAARSEVVDDLPSREHSQHVGVDVGQVHGGAGARARGPWRQALDARLRLAALQAQGECVGRAFRTRNDVAPRGELLEGEDADAFLADRARVGLLQGVEQVARHVSEALGRHASAEVLDGDVRAPALSSQDDADPLASLPGLGAAFETNSLSASFGSW